MPRRRRLSKLRRHRAGGSRQGRAPPGTGGCGSRCGLCARLALARDPLGSAKECYWDGDGDVDLTDYNWLASNFAPGGYGTAAVPEPASVCLLLAGLLALLFLGQIHGNAAKASPSSHQDSN